MNCTISNVQRHFAPYGFVSHSYYIAGTPSYHANKTVLVRLWAAYNAIVPPPLKKNLHVFLKKARCAAIWLLATPVFSEVANRLL